MEKTQILKTLKAIKENSPKRNFKQSIDLIINFKDLDTKKGEAKVDLYVQIPHSKGKKIKVCGLVGPELYEQAKKTLDSAVLSDDFPKLEKKKIKKLAAEHLYFIAQANIMPQIATVFGKALGPRARMPNPKAGCIVPPNANLAPLAAKLQNTIRIRIDKDPLFQTSIGMEDIPEDQISDNILALYNALIHALPNEKHNIKDMYLKLTMGKAMKIEAEDKQERIEQKKAPKKAIKAEQ